MMAVRKNNPDVVKLLATRGADITLKDADDRTSLFVAAEEDCVETFKVKRCYAGESKKVYPFGGL